MSQDKMVPAFKWRSSQGLFHAVDKMDTRHLFYTLRMIWNHTAPVHIRFYPFNRYTFSSFYSTSYMSKAIRAIMIELSSREDLTPEYIAVLNQMRDRLIKFNFIQEVEHVNVAATASRV